MKLKGFHKKDFLVKPGSKVALDRWPTDVKKLYDDEGEVETLLKLMQDEVASEQEKLYAEASQSLLIIVQGMDTSGKDGLVKHLMSGINPQGVMVRAFKRPSSEELSHDFLWRSQCALPPRGQIGIFNRSYYEEVIVTRVHPQLLENQRLPSQMKFNEKFWDARFKDINHYESYLRRQGWHILKFFLHISREEQKDRLLARIDDPSKHWKFEFGDIEEREHWADYQKAYSACLSQTSVEEAPWYILPADDKANTRLIASQLIVAALKEMNPNYPKTDKERLEKIKEAEVLLRSEKKRSSGRS